MRRESFFANAPARRLAALALAAAFLALPARAAYGAEAVGCVLTAEDVGNGNQYSVPGIGSFTINCQENETVPLAVFEAEGNCYLAVYRDGEPVETDGVIYDNGSYELRIYGSEAMEGDYGRFLFTVENDYSDLETETTIEVTEVENPALSLTWVPEREVFRYTLPDGTWFESTIPLGAWGRSAVRIVTDGQVRAYQIYRDGEIVGIGDILEFDETGGYEIVLRENELGSRGDTSYRVVLSFRLYKTEALNLSRLSSPMGLTLAEATLDGQKLPVGDGRAIQLERDGRYALLYTDGAGNPCYRMEFIRDTTPPRISFNVPLNGEKIRQDVSFVPSDPEADVYLERNRAEVIASTNDIRVNGIYHMEITDRAGNTREYDFTVEKIGMIPLPQLFLVALVVLALLLGGAVYWRGSMRVL